MEINVNKCALHTRPNSVLKTKLKHCLPPPSPQMFWSETHMKVSHLKSALGLIPRINTPRKKPQPKKEIKVPAVHSFNKTEMHEVLSKWRSELEDGLAKELSHRRIKRRKKAAVVHQWVKESKMKWEQEKEESLRIEKGLEMKLKTIFPKSVSSQPPRKKVSEISNTSSRAEPVSGHVPGDSHKSTRQTESVKSKDIKEVPSKKSIIIDEQTSKDKSPNIMQQMTSSNVPSKPSTKQSESGLFPWSSSFVPLTEDEKKQKLKIVSKLAVKTPFGFKKKEVDMDLHTQIQKQTEVNLASIKDKDYGTPCNRTAVQIMLKEEEGKTFLDSFTNHQMATGKMPYSTSASGTHIVFKDGVKYDKQLQPIVPLAGAPTDPELMRKLRWVDYPLLEGAMKLSDGKSVKSISKQDPSESHDILQRLYRNERRFYYDSDDEQQEERLAKKGISEFPKSVDELDENFLDSMFAVEEWRTCWKLLPQPFSQIKSEILLDTLVDFKCPDSLRKSAFATVIYALYRYRMPTVPLLEDLAGAQFCGTLLAKINQLINILHVIMQDRASMLHLGAALMIIALEDTSQEDKNKACNVLQESLESFYRLDRRFSALAMAQSGFISWPILRTLMEYWERAYKPKDLRYILLTLRKLSSHGVVVSSCVAEKLKSCNYEIRIKACLTMSLLKGDITKDVQDRLCAVMKNDWGHDVRIAAAKALGSIGHGELVHKHIVEMMNDSESRNVLEGLQLMSMLKLVSLDIIEALYHCVSHSISSVKLTAMNMVHDMNISHDKFIKAMCRLAMDYNAKVRQKAYETLGLLGISSPDVQIVLCSAVNMDEDANVRKAAIQSILALNVIDEKVCKALGHALKKEINVENRKLLVAVIKKHPHKVHDEELLEVNENDTEEEWKKKLMKHKMHRLIDNMADLFVNDDINTMDMQSIQQMLNRDYTTCAKQTVCINPELLPRNQQKNAPLKRPSHLPSALHQNEQRRRSKTITFNNIPEKKPKPKDNTETAYYKSILKQSAKIKPKMVSEPQFTMQSTPLQVKSKKPQRGTSESKKAKVKNNMQGKAPTHIPKAKVRTCRRKFNEDSTVSNKNIVFS